MLDHHLDDASPKLSEIMPSETKTLFPKDQEFSDWNNDFLDRHKSSASHVQAGLRVRALIGKKAKETNEKDLFAVLSLDSASMRHANAGVELLDKWGSSPQIKERYRKSAAERWKRASLFRGKHIDTQ